MFIFRRIKNIIKSILNSMIYNIERKNLPNFIKMEGESLKEELNKFDSKIVSFVEHQEQLKIKNEKMKESKEKIKAKIEIALQEKKENLAGQYILVLNKLEENISESNKYLEKFEKKYNQLIQHRVDYIKNYKQRMEKIKSDFELVESKKILFELSKKVNDFEIDNFKMSDSLDRIEKLVEDEEIKINTMYKISNDISNIDCVNNSDDEEISLKLAVEEYKNKSTNK